MVLAIEAGMGWSIANLDGIISQAMDKTTVIGLALVSNFVGLKFAYEYWRYSLGAAQGNNPTVPWDWQEIARVILIVLMITSYDGIANSFTKTINMVNSFTNKSSASSKTLEKEMNRYYVESKNAQRRDFNKMVDGMASSYAAKGQGDKVRAMNKVKEMMNAGSAGQYADGTFNGGNIDYNDLYQNASVNANSQYNSLFTNPLAVFDVDILSNGLSGLTLFIVSLIKWAVGTFYAALFGILLVFGPLVLAFSIFFREKSMYYFNQLVNVGLTFTTINIIDMVFGEFILRNFANPSIKESIAFNMAIIGLYWSAGKVTQMFIGQTGVNGIMQRGFGTAVAVVSGALTAASAVTSVATKGASSAGSSGSGGGLLSSVGKLGSAIGRTKNRVD